MRGPGEQEFARRGRLAELMQTKSGVEETGAAFGSDAAKFSADRDKRCAQLLRCIR